MSLYWHCMTAGAAGQTPRFAVTSPYIMVVQLLYKIVTELTLEFESILWKENNAMSLEAN